MKKTRKTRAKSPRVAFVGEAILKVLLAGTLVTTVALFPGVAYIIAPFIKKKKYNRRQAIQRNLDSLISHNLVNTGTNGNAQQTFTLTQKGRLLALVRSQKNLNNTQRKWDGIWRIVTFDISDQKTSARNALRRTMHMYGFKQLQKSVWVYPYECADFVKILKENFNFTKDLFFIRAKDIDCEQELKKEFAL